MKKLSCPAAVIALFATLLTFTSCHKNVAQPPLETQILGKWTTNAAIADHIDYGVNYSDTTLYTSNDYFEFKPDGTVSIMATEVSYNGNWKITGDSLVFTNTGYVDFPGGFKVVTLNQSDLKLSHTQNNPPDHWLDAKLNFKR